MSYPPPPGTSSSSLPPRPPPPVRTYQSAPTSTFSGFRPRSLAAPSPIVSAPPQHHNPYAHHHHPPHTYTQPPYPGAAAAAAAPTTYAPATYSAPTTTTPHIINPFPLPTAAAPYRRSDPRYPDLDPELQAQIAQQQSIYDPAARAAASSSTASGAALKGADGENAPTVLRQGGGQTWTDGTLLEWDPSHFRLFVGNLAGEVTDDSLLKAFAKYPSVQKARVIRDKRTTKSKGYGFVAFSDGDEYFRAAREMNGKYIGSHPVLLKRSNTEIKPVVVGAGGRKGKEGGGVLGGRVEKKKKKKGRGEERNVLG
ncbi:RNA-binding domain-containing protein [Morchella conica CCBAS932]|uniref:RNA-binding domain-containing protein n=1 Tax=Morchella conica CCBAS932 TaxID=1392247 RepID=A0A3N4L743_9PEZI|nr:RNA-binding domain-containing protein [Morchella conica CCBAS932]